MLALEKPLSVLPLLVHLFLFSHLPIIALVLIPTVTETVRGWTRPEHFILFVMITVEGSKTEF